MISIYIFTWINTSNKWSGIILNNANLKMRLTDFGTQNEPPKYKTISIITVVVSWCHQRGFSGTRLFLIMMPVLIFKKINWESSFNSFQMNAGLSIRLETIVNPQQLNSQSLAESIPAVHFNCFVGRSKSEHLRNNCNTIWPTHYFQWRSLEFAKCWTIQSNNVGIKGGGEGEKKNKNYVKGYSDSFVVTN